MPYSNQSSNKDEQEKSTTDEDIATKLNHYRAQQATRNRMNKTRQHQGSNTTGTSERDEELSETDEETDAINK